MGLGQSNNYNERDFEEKPLEDEEIEPKPKRVRIKYPIVDEEDYGILEQLIDGTGMIQSVISPPVSCDSGLSDQ